MSRCVSGPEIREDLMRELLREPVDPEAAAPDSSTTKEPT